MKSAKYAKRTSWEGCTPPDAFPHDGKNVRKVVFVAVRRDSLVTNNLINLCLSAGLDLRIMQDCEEECRRERDDLIWSVSHKTQKQTIQIPCQIHLSMRRFERKALIK